MSELVRGLLLFSRCELLLLETGSWGREHFGNSDEGECPLLEAATKQRQWRGDWTFVFMKEWIVNFSHTLYQSPINPVINLNKV
jgi:hypothetical protein